ncbi:MAG TPA: energy transducer TonB [Rhodanobacteraceae bacterium]
MWRLRLRTTLGLSALVVAGGIAMAWWMSAWPRLQDRSIEAAVAARQHVRIRPDRRAREPAPVRATRAPKPAVMPGVIPPAHAMAPLPPVAPAPVYAPSPAYPMEALRRQTGGAVTLRVSVDANGIVTAVGVARSSGDPALDASAQKAVRRWRFQAPARHAPMTFDYPVVFRIGTSKP